MCDADADKRTGLLLRAPYLANVLQQVRTTHMSGLVCLEEV